MPNNCRDLNRLLGHIVIHYLKANPIHYENDDDDLCVTSFIMFEGIHPSRV